ncbi:PilC/PilY family type IV pilus protein [Pseudomonas sp. BN415]|uniref:PilC/PilY family type IV pilus protein n=1 Tax=Pseudomonas sp. BN415 TaxID=2567889 RepID=UPI00245534B3|nr:PilC/PilY family type IV pilus protein [Pseudomonas sp. BN415]
MKCPGFGSRMLLWGLLVLAGGAQAQDTDLFMTNNPESDTRPNVLIILDNTSNWSSSSGTGSKFDIEREALAAVVKGFDEDAYNVGLMLFSEKGDDSSNSGGYVRSAIQRMTSANKDTLENLIKGLDEGTDKGSSAQYAYAMDEAYLYFEGFNARTGDKIKTDTAAFDGKPRYAKPITNGCASNYIIFISNGPPDQGENTKARALLTTRGGNTSQISLTPSGRQENWADEYARFLKGKLIQTYTIDVSPVTTGQGPDGTALLKSMAHQGGGDYHAVYNADELKTVLDNTFKQIQDVNSVFASTALPVSVNVRGTYLNEVYMGMFRPDAFAKPRWYGNLKLYQFAKDSATGVLYLADASSPPIAAQSPTTGFIRSNAKSFWTDVSDYWDYREDITASDSPDGDVVEKGGAAQQHRADYPTRNLYTCTGDCGSNSLLSETPFTNTNVATAALGVANDTERDALINWVRGADNTTPAERNSEEVRPSLHGDVVHSRPAIINFNRSSTEQDIVVFYGANDGLLRAVKGGKTADDGGTELWAFAMPEFFGQFKRLRDNSPAINVPSNPVPDSANKPYSVDGNISIYTNDIDGDGRIEGDSGEKAYLYVTMRRGGRFIYALDVSVPETPKLLWKRGCFASGCDDGYDEFGQSWSEAKVAKLNIGGVATPVLIMGAGYDAVADDAEPATAATTGRGILVINAITGNVIWQAGPAPDGGDSKESVSGMRYSIAADIAVIDRNRDGYADRLYAADTGANIWRVDIADQDPDEWEVHHFASLGGTGADARKFLYVPDVVYGSDDRGPFDAILLGSGDREHPFDTSVDNHFFMLKDRSVGLSGNGQSTITITELYDATDNLVQSSDATLKAAAKEQMLAARGWYFNLADGEKSVGNAVTAGGSVFFATNQPEPVDRSSCTSGLGIARIYVVNFEDGTPVTDLDGISGDDRSSLAVGGGFPPPPTSVITDIGETVCFGPFCKQPPEIDLDARRREYWYKEID